MKRFRNILAVYNEAVGADDVLSQATSLAKANSARLSLADVVEASHHPRAVLHERRKRLMRVAQALENEGLTDVESNVLLGTPFLEITCRDPARRLDAG